MDLGFVEEGVGLAEIVAQWRCFARNANVIHVELGVKRVSNDGVGEKLAELKGDHLHF